MYMAAPDAVTIFEVLDVIRRDPDQYLRGRSVFALRDYLDQVFRERAITLRPATPNFGMFGDWVARRLRITKPLADGRWSEYAGDYPHVIAQAQRSDAQGLDIFFHLLDDFRSHSRSPAAEARFEAGNKSDARLGPNELLATGLKAYRFLPESGFYLYLVCDQTFVPHADIREHRVGFFCDLSTIIRHAQRVFDVRPTQWHILGSDSRSQETSPDDLRVTKQ